MSRLPLPATDCVGDLDLIGTTVDGSHRVLGLPTDEELLADDAFRIADERSVEDLPAMI